MFLNDAQTGKTYRVEEFHLPLLLERRLEALGMTRGIPVRVINRKGKGILIVKVRGARFALGENITRNISASEVCNG